MGYIRHQTPYTSHQTLDSIAIILMLMEGLALSRARRRIIFKQPTVFQHSVCCWRPEFLIGSCWSAASNQVSGRLTERDQLQHNQFWNYRDCLLFGGRLQL